jgi:hypothetical protein
VLKRDAGHDYTLRSLQSILGVSRRVLSGLIDAGFVQPTRGKRNEPRFTFQDVVLLRTLFSCNYQIFRLAKYCARLEN